jgi:bacteriorhodopsin
VKSPDSAETAPDPAVAAAVRLMHRRRGWVWATVISVVAFLVACGLLGARAPNGSGAGIAVASVFVLPALVDGVAYLAGAENTVTFVPTSYGQMCGRGGCSTITYGHLGTAAGAPVTWTGQVPIGAPFTVRQPLWNWGFGTQLINGDGSAITYIILGVLFDGFAVLILFALYHAVRQWRRHRQQAASGLAIG